MPNHPVPASRFADPPANLPDPPQTFLPPLTSFFVRQALSIVWIEIRDPNPGNLPFSLHPCVYTDNFQVREVPVICLVLRPPEGLSLPGINPDVISTQLYRFAPRGPCSGFASTSNNSRFTKGTTSARVFTHPQTFNVSLIPTPPLFLGYQWPRRFRRKALRSRSTRSPRSPPQTSPRSSPSMTRPNLFPLFCHHR